MKAFKRLQRISPLTRFLLLSSILELLYAILCPLFPFNTPYSIYSPSNMNWLVTFTSLQSLSLKISVPSPRFSDPGSSLLLLILVLIALASIYLITAIYAFHASNSVHLTSHWLILPLIGALTFGVTLLYFPTVFNHDVQNYVYKGVSLLFHLINCVLIWIILSNIAPTRRLGGTILYAWNPLVLIELVGNGQSYGLLIFVLLLSALFVMKNKGQWYESWAMIFLGCASGINVISFLLAPMFIYFCALRKTTQPTRATSQSDGKQNATSIFPAKDSWRKYYLQLLWEIIWRTVVVLIIAFFLYLLLWQRSASFALIISSFDMQYLMRSPLSIMVLPVQWLNSLFFQILQPTTVLPSNYLQAIPAANMAVQASAMFIFSLLYIYLLCKVRSTDSLFASLCLAILGFLILLAVQFWPWYVIWMLWIVALRHFDALSICILLLSCTALLTYPLLYVDKAPITMYQPLLIFGIPLIYLITQLTRSNERMILFNDRRSETAKN